MPTTRQHTTQQLMQAAHGDAASVDRLMELVYAELRALAAAHRRKENRDHTLVPTAIVHEAYLRMVDQRKVDWNGRTHFFAIAAQQIRRVLLDHARGRNRIKRGGAWRRVGLGHAESLLEAAEIDVLDFEELLSKLESVDARLAEVVRLRFYGGLTVEEVGQRLGISPKTVEKDWRAARAWLRARYASEPGES